MRLATAIEIHGGGPGSGCRGPNCGRPEGSGKEPVKKYGTSLSKEEQDKLYKKQAAPVTPKATPGVLPQTKESLKKLKPAYKSGFKTEFNPDEKYKPPVKTATPEKEPLVEQHEKYLKDKFKKATEAAKYQWSQQEIINKSVLQEGDKVVLLRPLKTVSPTPPFNERTYPAGYEAKFKEFGQQYMTDLDNPDKLSGGPQAHITFGKSKYVEQVPLNDIQLLEKAPLPFEPAKAKPSQTVLSYTASDGSTVTVIKPKGEQGTGEHDRNFWKLEHQQKGSFDAETGFVQGVDDPKRFTQVFFASKPGGEHAGVLFPTQNNPAKEGTAVFIDRYQGSSKVVVTEARTGQYGYKASLWQRSYQNRNAADAFLNNRYGIQQNVPKGLKQSKGKKS